MAFDFAGFKDSQLNEQFISWLIDDQAVDIQRHFGRLWDYYQNQMSDATADRVNSESARPYVQAQEYGLPARITGISRNATDDVFSGRMLGDIHRKEVVIENDINWRINAMVDFLFGRGVNVVCKSENPTRRDEIERILKAVFAANGGVTFFQDMAVLGAVYGFVDCIVRLSPSMFKQTPSSSADKDTSTSITSFGRVIQFAGQCVLELIEAPRALPVLDENNYHKINYYVQHFWQCKNAVENNGNPFARLLGKKSGNMSRQTAEITEIIGPRFWQRYENQMLVAEGENSFGVVPVVHIQNIAQPYYYEGASDVEALVPLQDELNTRLSDRASRITFQAFKMYLAKGIENIENRCVAPGRMWCTDNPQASIESFGGDSSSPSEDMHIAEIREAMDKTSGVTPVVAGVLKGKLGNLTSAVALKMTLMGMLSKTDRKRNTYGEGIKQIAGLVMHALDVCGIYHTQPQDRQFEVIFPNPLPENTLEKLEEAMMKKDIGVPQEVILQELGYENK